MNVLVNPSNLMRRMLAALGVLLLLFSSSADALGVHRCAHHDQLPAAEATNHDHHADHSSSGDEKEATHGCTCVGTCSTTVAPGLSVTDAVFDDVPTTFSAIAAAPVFVRAQRIEFLLPYSTAPPAAL